MSFRYPGAVMKGLTPITSTVSAVGIWNIRHQMQAQAAEAWPIATSPPDAPGISSVTVIDYTTVTVSFTAPAFDGKATITSYTATSSPGGITGTVTQSGSGTITITGLTELTNYTFTVTATNNRGTGDSASASNSITTPLHT